MTESSSGQRTPSQQVADDLRDAFALLAAAQLAPAEHATYQRRLLAITTTSKRDIDRAREQLDRFDRDLRAAMNE